MSIQIEPPKLPLPSNALSSGFAYPHPLVQVDPEDHFEEVQARDRNSCVICDVHDTDVCRIAPGCVDEWSWRKLRQTGYIPEGSRSASQEPRNHFLLCITHRLMFEHLRFFIRYIPEQQKFIFINHSQFSSPLCKDFHGKALALDINDPLAPFPISFLLHELSVRASAHQLFDHQVQTIVQDNQDNVPDFEGYSTPIISSCR